MTCKHVLLITSLKEPKLIILLTVKWFQVLLCITNNSIKYQSFVYTQLNHQIVLFQIIQFCSSHLFTLSLNVKQFHLTHKLDPIRCYYSGPEWTWEQWQWRGIPHFPNLQGWSLAIRWFNVMRYYPSAEMKPVYSTPLAGWAILIIEFLCSTCWISVAFS